MSKISSRMGFLIVILGHFLGGCASWEHQPPRREPAHMVERVVERRGFYLPPALSEVLRNGELKGLEQSTDGVLGIPPDDALTQRVCVSKPHFNLYGQYVTTLVKCY